MQFKEEFRNFLARRKSISAVARKAYMDPSYIHYIIKRDGTRYETLLVILNNNDATELEMCRVMWAAGYVPPMVRDLEIRQSLINRLKLEHSGAI